MPPRPPKAPPNTKHEERETPEEDTSTHSDNGLIRDEDEIKIKDFVKSVESDTLKEDDEESLPDAIEDANSDTADISPDISTDDSELPVEYDSAGESWSEGSTDLDEFQMDGDDGGDSLTSSFTSSSSESAQSSDSEQSLTYADIQRSGYDILEIDKDEDMGDNEYVNSKFQRYRSGVPTGVITIFDTASNPPKKLSQHYHPMSIHLYGSPPAIHPNNSLLPWPLCYGDILFADFKAAYYYIRRVKTTTRRSKPIFS
jgi:hypothetical protein